MIGQEENIVTFKQKIDSMKSHENTLRQEHADGQMSNAVNDIPFSFLS